MDGMPESANNIPEVPVPSKEVPLLVVSRSEPHPEIERLGKDHLERSRIESTCNIVTETVDNVVTERIGDVVTDTSNGVSETIDNVVASTISDVVTDTMYSVVNEKIANFRTTTIDNVVTEPEGSLRSEVDDDEAKLMDGTTPSSNFLEKEFGNGKAKEIEGGAPSNALETVMEASPEVLDQSIPEAMDQPVSRAHDVLIDSFSSSNIPKLKPFLNPFISIEAAKASILLNRTPFPSTFDNNVVSSVEGETVLIVENLNLTSQSQKKDDGELPDPHEETDIDWSTVVGKRVRKQFGKKLFEGDVIEYDADKNCYKVVYEDGDEEELEGKEVRRLLVLSDDAMEDDSYEKRRHRLSGSVSNNIKRSTKKGKKDTEHEASEDGIKERKLRGFRKSIVIDTSNDESDVQGSASSDQTSDVNDEPVMKKRSSSLRKSRWKGRDKKRKIVDKSDSEKEDNGIQTRLSSRYKDDAHSRIQEIPTEHPISTRKSTSSLNIHSITSDGLISSKLTDSLLRKDGSTSELPDPEGGGVKLVGRRTQKDFGGELYNGEIIGYDNRVKYYKVFYEDGDEEELEWSELEPTLLPEEENQQNLTLDGPPQIESELSKGRLKDHSKNKQEANSLYEGDTTNGELPMSTRRWRKRNQTTHVSNMIKGMDDSDVASPIPDSHPPPRPLVTARFASASDADTFEYFGWGEVVNFERSKCPELRATRLLPTSSPVVHLAASHHHLVALTAAGQVWIWRCKHGNIHTRCNKWEHISLLDEKHIILVDIAGPDVDRASAGYQAEQEDQVPDPFYLVAVGSNGEDIILQGSQAHEPVHTYQFEHEPRHLSLRESFFVSNPDASKDVGRIVQVSVGMVEAADESPFIGYITDTESVYMRSATRDYMEEVNLVTGYTGKPIKIQCGRVYHAIMMTDDGRAWTWGQGYYPGSNLVSTGFANKWPSPFSLCQPAVGTLVGRKVIDVGCYGEDFIALTNDGEVHHWTHGRPNPASGVYNVPATLVDGQGPSITSGDKLKQVAIGAGVCSGILESGKVHTWRTSMRGGFVGIVGSEQEALTPLGRDEGFKDTSILSLAAREATKVVCVASSLLVVVRRKTRGRRGWKKKSSLKGEEVQNETIT